MENPTASGEYFSDSCGDLYTFFLKVGTGDVIEDVSYFTTGCGFGTATCSLLVELVRGKTVDEALAITDADIEAALDGYPEKKKDYPERSRFALQAAVATLNEEGLGPPIEIGVGVHTGLVTFGTVGDARHIDTTVVAETVNSAKRIEGLSKRLRVPVVTTGKVVRAIREREKYFVRPLGPQLVRGKREPLVVYAVDRAPLVQAVTARRAEHSDQQ